MSAAGFSPQKRRAPSMRREWIQARMQQDGGRIPTECASASAPVLAAAQRGILCAPRIALFEKEETGGGEKDAERESWATMERRTGRAAVAMQPPLSFSRHKETEAVRIEKGRGTPRGQALVSARLFPALADIELSRRFP